MYEYLEVIGVELANRLLKAGFELAEIKLGKSTTIYHFYDSEELRKEIEAYLEEK